MAAAQVPGYRELTPVEWREKSDFFSDLFSPCGQCPRQCRAERQKDQKGTCQAGKEVKVASFNLHFGEEPPISGRRGSGTIFFSGCTLKCLFCQNYPISHLCHGTFYSIEQLAGIMLFLQKQGGHNINLVSPTPYLHHWIEAMILAVAKGLAIPIVYNTSGYERPEVIKILNGLVDIYLPDLKYRDSETAFQFSGVKNYFDFALPAISEMISQTGELVQDSSGVAQRGTIIRHLIIPGQIENSKAVLKSIKESSLAKAHLSLMSQFFPAYRAVEHPEIGRRLSASEYRQVRDYAIELGIDRGWFQEMD